MRLYLDNCCFNRPFDNQHFIRIKLETEAKLFIQEKILNEKLELVWSYILDYENKANPFEIRQNAIKSWTEVSKVIITEGTEVLKQGKDLQKKGLNSKDALHVACAVIAGCDYFITTDDSIIKKLKDFDKVKVINPIDFIYLWSFDENK